MRPPPLVPPVPLRGTGHNCDASLYGLYAIIVIASVTAVILTIGVFFRGVRAGYTREAVITGFVWLMCSWVLDLIIVVTLPGIPLPDHAVQIGLLYPMVPAIVNAAGAVADDAVRGDSGKIS